MKKHIIAIGIVILLLAVGLSGCNELDNSNGNGNTSSELDKFVGDWVIEQQSNSYLTIFSDGTCSYYGSSGFWEIKDGRLVLDLYSQGRTEVFSYYFSENNTKLHLKASYQEDYETYIKK